MRTLLKEKVKLCFLVFLIMCSVVMVAGAETAEANGHALTRFSFSRWGEMKQKTWEVLWEGNDCTIREDEGEPRPFAADLATELAQVVLDYDLESWNGEYSTGYEVLDGECFSLELEFSDGTVVSATGDNAFPERYDEATDAMYDIFEREKTGAIAGTYRYDGEGFGGDFAITLNADGTYTFYEGPLSSYMGMGTWYTAYDAVYMNEGDAGFDLSFMFGIEGDSLIYLAWGSDAFPTIEVPDGERFVRVDSIELYIGDTEVPVSWEDNESVTVLKALLPLTIKMSMYGGFEQVGSIGQSVSRDDRQTTTQPGDIVLYSGDQIVIFYGSNSWAYTRLGHIELSRQEMTALLSQGDVVITIR